VHLDTLADSAIRLAVLKLSTPRSPAERLPIDVRLDFALPAGTATARVERELGRVDLNTADDDMLFALFAANGWEEGAARAMTSRILDWRDADDRPRTEGAERADYRAAERRYTPRNGPFESIDEVKQVLGGESISAAVLDSLTVYTHTLVPTESLATESVRRALAFADEHRLGEHSWSIAHESTTAGTAPDAPARTLIGEIVRVHACARGAKYERCRLLIARLTCSVITPVQVFAWLDDYRAVSAFK
jgi:general secretion pathway protein K